MTAALEISRVVKDYRGLRPFRLEGLDLAPGDVIALLGFDRISAEVLVNLITGTVLPDAGTLRVFGRSTADIKDSTEWMALVDRFGIFSERAALLDGLSVVQNLALPFTLEIDPPPAGVRGQAERLAREAGLPVEALDVRVSDLDGTARMRVRLGRALALDPHVLLLEHPTAGIARGDVELFGRQVRGAVERRGVAALALTADRAFAEAFARRVLTWDPSTGRLTAAAGWFARWRIR